MITGLEALKSRWQGARVTLGSGGGCIPSPGRRFIPGEITSITARAAAVACDGRADGVFEAIIGKGSVEQNIRGVSDLLEDELNRCICGYGIAGEVARAGDGQRVGDPRRQGRGGGNSYGRTVRIKQCIGRRDIPWSEDVIGRIFGGRFVHQLIKVKCDRAETATDTR